MFLSIIIPAYNEALVLAATMKQIKEALQGITHAFEIIVCDNNSSDQTALLAFRAGAKVVCEPINQISRARNTGAKIANGEWLLFIDADTYPSKAFMEDFFDLIKNEQLIGGGSTVEVVDGTLFNKLRMERLNPLMRWGNWCGGAFLFVKAKAFKSIGGFSLELYALEEIDFVIRLKKLARREKKYFKVLHKNPVYTSGRKVSNKLSSIFNVFWSNILALFLLAAYFILPKSWQLKKHSKWLKYWYGDR